MKKKTSWKTFAGLALAAGTWLKLSEILPSEEPGEPPFKPTCKDGFRLDWDASARRWVCVPRL